jgi:phenylacetate-coenzyme A ligase PaaK-like adenylate-forming protein
MDINNLRDAIFKVDKPGFEALAMLLFHYQSVHCEVYKRYLNHLQVDSSKITNSEDIPYLPIQFFKDFEIKTNQFQEDQTFVSSSTTGIGVSKHFVKDIQVYKNAFTTCFDIAFGNYRDYCHLALLPSYLERNNSSLVYQVDYFIQNSKYSNSAFYLRNHNDLLKQLKKNEEDQIPTILWGVSFGLLDFIEDHHLPLQHTTVIETGGMKGRRKEITREELHTHLTEAFSLSNIAGEYGMTELMSQAYAKQKGLYACPPWMKVSIREINDPLGKPILKRHGAINIIDLANFNSCAFIATSDLGRAFDNGDFEVLGRIDHSDTRGCNLLL